MKRRSFLKSSLAAAAATLLSRVRASAAELPPLIVDTHQHLWDLSKFTLPWLGTDKSLLNRTYHLKEYAEATRGLNMKSVYMEVDVDASQLVAEAEHVIALSREANPTVAAVIGCRPEADDFAGYVDRWRGVPEVKGMRHVLHNDATPRGFCLADRFVKSMRLLGQRGLSFDLCMRPKELSDGATLAASCPNTRFIVDHCGNADPLAFRPARAGGVPGSHTVDEWKAGIDKLAALPNVICKISGIIARLPKGGDANDLAPIVDYCLDAFGPDRVVFGGDWPVCLTGGSLRTWVDMLSEIIAARPAADRTKLWSANAVRHYSLAIAGT
jgi:predicted TIM-barrel fold metal-dependent hydrolase